TTRQNGAYCLSLGPGKTFGESANVEHKLKAGPSLCVTEQPSKAVAEASSWSDLMAKVIEFYLRGPLAKTVKPIPIERHGKLVELPKHSEHPVDGAFDSVELQFKIRADDKLTLFDFTSGDVTSSHG